MGAGDPEAVGELGADAPQADGRQTTDTPDGRYTTVVGRRRRKSKGQRPERVRTTAAPAPARAAPTRAESQPRPASDVVIEIVAGDAEGAKEKPVSTAWTCTSCLAEHRDDWKTLCCICEKP